MSRRDSRLSLNVRQNDALNEFENFKKKFLLANKHITKLNSTLSVRIEELNAQISTLYVENLRLRESEIALGAQLKKEQEKSRKVMADAEAASFGIASSVPLLVREAKPPPPPLPRARRPVLDPNASPQIPKLSRAPNVPGIYEDEEVASSPEREEDEVGRVLSPTIRRKSKKEKERKIKEVERELPAEEGEAAMSLRVREKKRRRHEDYSGLKDVTNSPRSRAMLPPLDTNTTSDRDRQHAPDTGGSTPISGVTSLATTRSFLSTPATTPATAISEVSHWPTPRTSSSPIPPPPPCASTSELEGAVGGRERRLRRSINYAEPKLNTKMRKPDQTPMQPVVAAAVKKRLSTTIVREDDLECTRSVSVAVEGSSSQGKSALPLARSSSGASTSTSTSSSSNIVIKRKKSRPYVDVEAEESEGAQADAEYGNINGWVNVEGRRRSVQHGGVRRALEGDDGRRQSCAV